MPDLLLELFSEEIPARMQPRAREDLRRLVTDGLVEAGLTYAGAVAFSTPRRLVLHVEGLDAASRPRREERRGPRVGAPEKAIAGFLRATGLRLEDLEIREDRKGQSYWAVIEHPGRPAEDILAELIPQVIRGFPWPKSMRWGSGRLRWVRPLHAILCILSDSDGARVVPFEIEGIAAGDVTRGHRFMAPAPFRVRSFDDYQSGLMRAFVMLDQERRAETIRTELVNGAFARGRELVEDPGLLTEVTGLVEWPVVLIGEIEPRFLELPPEVLRTSMREHQKFFSLRDPASGRIDAFATVAGRETADGGATILAGNRKVLAARLEDARFFWHNDLRVAREEALRPWLEALEQVTFHRRLGTQADRVRRMMALAERLALELGADPERARRAAELAKADLASEMVYEFPELQGVMGRYYIAAAGEPEEVARAAEEHYRPLGPGDAVPSAPVSVAVALADKLDMLAGFWAIDEKPTGSKDPFALRRAALGVIRILLENRLRLRLADWIGHALAGHAALIAAGRAGEGGEEGAALEAIGADLLGFFHDRLKVHLRERGIRHDVIDAVLAMPGADDLVAVVARAEALAAFLATEDGENLLLGFRRANNILEQAEARDGVSYSFGADPKFAETDSERALFAALDRAEAEIGPALAEEDFTRAMAAMARLRAPIDAFFEDVQVNTDNEIIRRNRLNLLSRIRDICLSVADLRRIEG
ncbi:MAG: glycine--tRNA ligase subunit beta [Alphaproteobacteria bacterium]|nr:MAG: glycine--tRNA ligase subunit beta [Alphaproteobacteria bacterium]